MSLRDNTVGALVQHAIQRIAAVHDQREAGNMAVWIMEEKLGLSRVDLVMKSEDRVSESEINMVWDVLHALEAGEPVTVKPEGVAADSLGASSAGPMMFPIAQSYVDHVALVSDDAITATQAWCWQKLRLAAEPGGAAALAALLHGAYKPAKGERVGVIMCGANVELSKLDALIS